MKRLHILTIKSYFGPLAFTFFIAIFLLIMQWFWKWIDELVGKGLEIDILAELLIYTSARLVRMALVLAILLSSIMTFGNLGENYELVAIKSSGISLFRIMKPLIIFHILISIAAFYFANNIEPRANLKFFTLLRDIREQQPEFDLKEGVFYNGIEGYSIKIGEKSRDSNSLYNIMIYDHTENRGNTKMTRADSGTMEISSDKKYLILKLYEGITISAEIERSNKKYEKRYPLTRDSFREKQIILTLPGNELERSNENYYRNLYMMLNLKQLKHSVDSLNSSFVRRQNFYVRRHQTKSYFKAERSSERVEQVSSADSLVPVINSDSLFQTHDKSTKKFVIDKALDYAREAKTNINDSDINLKSYKRNIHRHEIEWHRKFTLSVACLIFFFIGAPLGAIIRKGGMGMPVVVSVIFFLIYYIISISGEKYARVGALSATEGMWLSTIIILPLSFFLTYKATRESGMMNIDNYFNTIKKVLKFKRKTRSR